MILQLFVLIALTSLDAESITTACTEFVENGYSVSMFGAYEPYVELRYSTNDCSGDADTTFINDNFYLNISADGSLQAYLSSYCEGIGHLTDTDGDCIFDDIDPSALSEEECYSSLIRFIFNV